MDASQPKRDTHENESAPTTQTACLTGNDKRQWGGQYGEVTALPGLATVNTGRLGLEIEGEEFECADVTVADGDSGVALLVGASLPDEDGRSLGTSLTVQLDAAGAASLLNLLAEAVDVEHDRANNEEYRPGAVSDGRAARHNL